MKVDRPPRVRVACTLCSAAKLRCDLNRPCARCYQRGTADECHDRPVVRKCPKGRSKSDTCGPCRKAKLACKSMERPCPRCVRLGIDCLSGTIHEKGYCIDRHQALRTASIIPVEDQWSLSSSFLMAIFQCFGRYSRDQLAQFLFFPEKLDHLSKITCSFVRLDDRLQIRRWFYDNFPDHQYQKYEHRAKYFAREQVIEQACRIYRHCYGPVLLYDNDVPVIQYHVDYNNPLQAFYTLVLNPLADSLLQYSSSGLTSISGVLCHYEFGQEEPITFPESIGQSGIIPDIFWRLFPYTSWEDILYWIMDIFVLGLPSAEFGVEMMAKDGQIMDVKSIWRIFHHQGTLLLTVTVTDMSPIF